MMCASSYKKYQIMGQKWQKYQNKVVNMRNTPPPVRQPQVRPHALHAGAGKS